MTLRRLAATLRLVRKYRTRGKSVTIVTADGAGEQGLSTRCVFAFGVARGMTARPMRFANALFAAEPQQEILLTPGSFPLRSSLRPLRADFLVLYML